jgi:hypothetical protein
MIKDEIEKLRYSPLRFDRSMLGFRWRCVCYLYYYCLWRFWRCVGRVFFGAGKK